MKKLITLLLLLFVINLGASKFSDTKKKAKQGDAEAQYSLGWMYDDGEGTSVNKKKAFEWCKKSAEQGYAPAQHNLGWMYDDGEGTEVDKKQAKEVWEKLELWKYE